MRDEGDFEAYAVARWSALVRTAVLLGSRRDVAPRLARATLARVRAGWRRRDEIGDLDAHLYRTLLDVRRDDRVAWWTETVPAGDPIDAAALAALGTALDSLTPPDRAALVLRSVAGLGPEQVELVLGRTLDRAPVDDDLRHLADSLHVAPVLLAEVVAEQRAERRARVRRTTVTAGAVVAVLAVVVGGLTWSATRPQPRAPLADAPVERSANPAPVAWYTASVLHLADVQLRVEAVRTFFEVDDGAVYADANGEIVHVDTAGQRTRIGTQRRDGSFQVSAEERLVAWIDQGDGPGDGPGGGRQLRVYDLDEDEVVGEHVLGPDEDSDVVALDSGTAYYVEQGRNYAFEVDEDDVVELASPKVLDVASGAIARQDDDAVVSLASPRDQEDRILSVPGIGAELSRDGAMVLTRTINPFSEIGTVHLYDARSATELDTGLTPGATVFAAHLLPDGAATYLVELEQPDPEDGARLSNAGSLQLTSCLAPVPGATTPCEVVLTFPRSTTWALAQTGPVVGPSSRAQ